MKILIIAIYGIILFIIAIYSALKVKTPADYFVAGKNNSFPKVAGSLLATILGGAAVLGTANLAENQSWAAAWYLLAASAGLWLLLPLVKKVNRLGKFTLTDMIGRFYGETARKTAAVIIPLAWTGVVAAQIIAAAKILFTIFAIPYEYGVLISGIAFILYTFIGGQVSILKTDLYQSIIILTGITISAIFLSRVQGIDTTPLTVTFPFNINFGPIDLLILFLTFSSTFVVGPDIYSRVFCAKDENTARTSIIIVASVLIPFAFLLTYLGIFAYENLPAEKLHNSVVLIELIDFYLPDWVVGLMAAALLSAVLSSADTTLLSASMILSELVNKDIDNTRSWNTTRFFVLVTGVASMFIALKLTSIIGTLLLALAFYSGAFIVPLILALTNVKITGKREQNQARLSFAGGGQFTGDGQFAPEVKINTKMSIPAMITGGLIALTGKILVDFFDLSWGNWIIISAFAINFLLLKTRTAMLRILLFLNDHIKSAKSHL